MVLIDFLALLTTSVAFLLTVMLTTAISGKIIKVERNHQAKRIGSKEYQSFGIAFPLFLAEAVVIAILFGYFQTAIEQVLWANILLLPTFFIEADTFYYFWFCVEYDYNPFRYWKTIVAFQILVALNLLFVYFLHQPIFTWPRF